jgi:hypothetical protein
MRVVAGWACSYDHHHDHHDYDYDYDYDYDGCANDHNLRNT